MADLVSIPSIAVACPANWRAKKGCRAWGSVIPTDHGCKLDPGHKGRHVCPCGASTNTPMKELDDG
jgi:hypothetical protein